MPRDSQGVYTLPPGYRAIGGETIQPFQHNPPLEDIAAALTDALTRDGAAAMTGQLKAAAGTVAAPGLAFAIGTSTGLYKTSDGIGVTVNGAKVAEFTGAGFSGGIPVGTGMDYWGQTPPPGWLFAAGQVLLRASYPALFAVIGTFHNTGGETSLQFRMPDKRGRASFAADGMGGTVAGRITGANGTFNSVALGGVGGTETHALTGLEGPVHGHAANVNDPGHLHGGLQGAGAVAVGPGVGNTVVTQAAQTTDVRLTGISVSIVNSGGGQAHNNMPPGIICNYIIYAGV